MDSAPAACLPPCRTGFCSTVRFQSEHLLEGTEQHIPSHWDGDACSNGWVPKGGGVCVCVCGRVLWEHGPPGRGVARSRAEEGGRVWELLAMEAVKAPFQLSELL